MMPKLWSSFFRGILGILIGAFFLWLSLHQSNVETLGAVLSKINVGWVLISLSFYIIELFARVARWRILLDIKTLSFKSVGIALLVGYSANNLLPARLGELFRADFAGRRYHLSRSTVAGSIFVERVLDGLIVVLCLTLGRLFVSEQKVLSSLTTSSAVLFVSIFIALWFMGRESSPSWFSRRFPSIAKRIQSFRKGLSLMRGVGLIKVVRLSLMIWLLEGILFWAILKAVNVSLGWQQMLTVVGVVSLSSLIPSAPGFVGTYQYAFAFSVGLFGYEATLGIAAATATQIFLLGSVTFLGLSLYTFLLFKQKKGRG
jgi:glycosyltransferase 2 family protein